VKHNKPNSAFEGIQVMSQFMSAKILPAGMPADEQEVLVKDHMVSFYA
jgi:hypothetical protein